MFEKEVIIAELQSQLAAYAELREKAEEYRNAAELAEGIFFWHPDEGIYCDARDKARQNLFAALDKLGE